MEIEVALKGKGRAKTANDNLQKEVTIAQAFAAEYTPSSF